MWGPLPLEAKSWRPSHALTPSCILPWPAAQLSSLCIVLVVIVLACRSTFELSSSPEPLSPPVTCWSAGAQVVPSLGYQVLSSLHILVNLSEWKWLRMVLMSSLLEHQRPEDDVLAGELHLHQGGLRHKVGGSAMVGWKRVIWNKGLIIGLCLFSGIRRQAGGSRVAPISKGVPIMALFPYLLAHTEEPS